MDYIRAIERQQIREDIPQVRVADNVKVHYRIKEGDRERIQVFQATSSAWPAPVPRDLHRPQDVLRCRC